MILNKLKYRTVYFIISFETPYTTQTMCDICILHSLYMITDYMQSKTISRVKESQVMLM